MEEAADRARSYTNGQGADATMITVGRMEPGDLTAAVDSIRKGGTVAMTSMGAFRPEDVSLDLSMVTLMQKTIKGVIYGNWSPFEAVPTMLALYASGELKTDEMVTRTYALDEIAQGYRDMKQGKNIRSIVEFS
jgi:S-(hydroxymethyl)glutathione dehydrogenase/alcohol dehydrogenase